MLRMAVATDAETTERMREPLRERGIEVEYVQPSDRTFSLRAGSPAQVDVGFVFPSRVMEGGVVDALLDVPWVNDRETVLRSRNKAEVYARLDGTKVPVPETTLISNPVDERELIDAFEGIHGQVVVKPNSTTRGTGVAKAQDVDSFLGICDYLDLIHDYSATGDKSFLVQEFIPDARDYRAMVVDGRFTGAVERRLPEDAVAAGQWKHNVHRGARATGVDLPANLRELAEDVAAALEMDWVGVDLLVSGDRAVVTETNARPTIDAATKYEPGFYRELAALIRATAGE
ncbi:MAG: RimK family alpha-L-glutamate ligase [Haloarculaceae archaeon]